MWDGIDMTETGPHTNPPLINKNKKQSILLLFLVRNMFGFSFYFLKSIPLPVSSDFPVAKTDRFIMCYQYKTDHFS